jgi:hypothetical protein
MGLDAGYGIGSLKPGVCTSSTLPASPFVGQVVYMTDVDQSAVWDGSEWVGLDPSRNRNVVINGAMQVAQRGTSTASITTSGYYTADRFTLSASSLGTWTQSVEADAPTGSGLRKSLKMLCTTADAAPSAGDIMVLEQKLEGQNLQQFLKGTASAKPFSLSFWIKGNVTGTYIAELFDATNTRSVSASYTISVSATWEKKTITFPADTTGAFANDNTASLSCIFWLGAGTNWTSGTLATTWGATVSANRGVGQTNLAAATSNYWQVTGIQVEAGAVATPFESEDYGTTLAKCQRYYIRMTGEAAFSFMGSGIGYSSTLTVTSSVLPVKMRSVPTVVEFLSLRVTNVLSTYAISAVILDGNFENSYQPVFDCTTTGLTAGNFYFVGSNATTNSYLAFGAEL